MLAGEQSAVLFELRGDHPGTVNVISEDVFRIGSDVENDLVLKDQEIALYQAEIRRGPEGFVIRNLSAEVPVYLNGEAFEVGTLQRGDILTLGKGVYRFVAFGETLRKVDLWEPVGGVQTTTVPSRKATLRRRSFLAGLTVFSVALVMLLMWLLRHEPSPGPKAGLEEPPAFQGTPAIGRIQAMYDHGVDLLSARRWDEAVLIFESIRDVTPNYKDTEERFRAAMLESESMDKLNQGKGLFGEGDLERAKLRLETVPERSVYGNEARQLVREIDGQLVGEKIQEAEASLRKQDWAAARSKAKAVLFLSPNSRRAVGILRESERLRQSQAAPGVAAAFPSPAPPARAPSQRAVSRSRPRRLAPVTAPRGTPQWHVQRAVNVYQKGDPDRSMETLRPVLRKQSTAPPSVAKQAREMRNDLVLAKSYFEQARQLQEQKQIADAVEMWEKFLETDRRLSGEWGSEMLGEASSHLSTIYYDRGKEEYDRGNLGEAFFYWNMAGQIHEKDEDVQEGLQQLAQSAQEFYREGYSLYDVNPSRAVKKWQEVLEIVPEDDPYHRKARHRMRSSYQGDPSLPRMEGNVDMAAIQESTRNFFREGYCIQYVNPEGAIARWLEIVEQATPGDPYYHKAMQQIEKKRMLP